MVNKSLGTITDRKSKLEHLLNEMQHGLLERETQVKLVLLAALAGEHVLLLGPPGTAKSELAKRLQSIFVEARYFERLLTRFSVPEELFGPLSIKALEEDRYNRLTSGYLPEASVAFIDEIFKANSAILNSLLTLLNERKFDNGNRREAVSLISVVAASNELPDGQELSALYDRFMLRSYVDPVSGDSFRKLLELDDELCDPDLSYRLRIDDIEDVQRMSRKVKLSGPALSLCEAFRGYLLDHEIYVSDRRWRKIIKLMRVSSFTNNQTEVTVYDAWLLPHCLWEKPEQLEGLINFYKTNISIQADFQPTNLTTALTAWEDRLEQDRKVKKQVVNQKGELLYVGKGGRPVTVKTRKQQKRNEDGELLFSNGPHIETTKKSGTYGKENEKVMIDVPNEPCMGIIEFSKAHISGRVAQVSELKTRISSFLLRLQQQSLSAEELLKNHLWVDPFIWPEVSDSLKNAISQAEKLKQRAEKLISGFEALPQESADSALLPGGADLDVVDVSGMVLQGEFSE